MIYTVGGIKGGSGKTTIATNFTVYLASQNRDVLLVDADDQETSTDFTSWRNDRTGSNCGYTAIQLANDSVRTEVLKLSKKYDDIIIDTGGRDTTSQRSALVVSDVYLVPFVPRSFDIWTLEKVTKLIREIITVNPKLKPVCFLNRTDSRGVDNEEAAIFLKEANDIQFLDAPLATRKSYSNAAANGMAVFEVKPKDLKAEEEFLYLMNELDNLNKQLEQPLINLVTTL